MDLVKRQFIRDQGLRWGFLCKHIATAVFNDKFTKLSTSGSSTGQRPLESFVGLEANTSWDVWSHLFYYREILETQQETAGKGKQLRDNWFWISLATELKKNKI